MILLIDNYDSFTFNLYQQLGSLGAEVTVKKNDEVSSQSIREMNPGALIISPGPKTPADSGNCISIIRELYTTLPILGVCLGHQCIAAAFRQEILPARQLLFGKTSMVKRSNSRLLKDLPKSFEAARYHSLVIDKAPVAFQVTSWDDRGDIMSIEHDILPVFGIQFHPESFLMQHTGDRIIRKFLEMV